MDPDDARVNNGMGVALTSRGLQKKAISYLLKAADRVSVLKLAASLMAMTADASVRNGPEAVTWCGGQAI
jgi:hypothetical protein